MSNVYGLDVQFDSKAYEEALERITDKEWEKLARKSVASGGSVLINETKKQLRIKIGKAKAQSKHYSLTRGLNLKRKGNPKTLEQGIRHKVHKEQDVVVDKVNIMGDFRLKFWETGAGKKSAALRPPKRKNRYSANGKRIGRPPTRKISYATVDGVRVTKKGQSRGRINATWFFDTAKMKARNAMESKMREVVDKGLKVLWLAKK